ncbi:T9SS type A sorting domain-containing protein [bacterium]|nr:T9SS type A sorting domain-containing protein [bacterium]
MRHVLRLLGTTLLMLTVFALCAQSATLQFTLEFSEQDLSITERDGFHIIRLGTHLLTDEVGSPQLPLVPVLLALPPGARVTGVTVENTESTDIIGTFLPFPSQPPRLLPIPGVRLPVKPFVRPGRTGYQGAAAYPGDVVRLTSASMLAANTMVGLVAHPVQFLPERGRLRFFRTITFAVEYVTGSAPPLRRSTGLRTAHDLAPVVGNPADVRPERSFLRERTDRLDAATVEYVIVTTAALEPGFQPLADWKTRKGVPASIVTIEWIDATYEGEDAAERVRAFIADAHDTWETTWILLGGDTAVVPVRYAFAMDCEANYQPDDNDIPCDLYYSDLDGDWNADGDAVFGEVADGIDLIADVFVGRASVETMDDVDAFVAKTLSWEHGDNGGYQLDMLFAGEILWSDPYTDSGLGLDMIDSESVPPRYDPIDKQYESQGNESRESIIAALNDGQCHFLHDGHAWFTVLGCGDGYLDRADASALTNLTAQPLVYSIGCWPAAFDKDCVAERFVENPSGGAAAFIGNSRYGWGSPGNPGYGYSDRFMAEYYRCVFLDAVRHAGTALAAAKAAFAPLSQTENVYRWHQYELNLLGDPEMPLWTDHPIVLNVAHPESVSTSGSPVDVIVWTTQGTVENALVCVTNGHDLYERALTGPDGSVTLSVSTTQPHELAITVTAANSLPYESTIAVGLTGAYLTAGDITFDDGAGGNGDGLPGPAETTDMTFTVTNLGGGSAPDATAVITTSDVWITPLADSAAFGEIAAGATVASTTPYSIQIGAGCPDGHVALLEVAISSAGLGETWNEVLPVTVHAPVLSVASYSIDDASGGDGDGIAEPGENLRVMVELLNSGGATARSPVATLWSSDTWAHVLSGAVGMQSVPSGQRGQVVFDVSLTLDCPLPHFPEFQLETVTSDDQTGVDTLTVSVGTTGFTTDFEGPAIGWSHGGANSLWHATDHRAHSGSKSWYCGQDASWQYANLMAAHFDSPEFVLGAETELSFWCWYDVTIYGVDGLYVQTLSHGVPSDTLDFIGSGGALETLGSIGNDWIEYTYDLEGEPGDTVQIRFLFVSDGTDVAEGVYVDDVTVSTLIESSGTSVPDDADQLPLLQLAQNCPNPFTPSTTIRFALALPGDVNLSVYGIQGRLIRTLVDGARSAGSHIVEWDGRDAGGVEVAAGVYLYRLSIGETEETRKMILVR